MNPSTPSVTTSEPPALGVVMIGIPQAMASNCTKASPSTREGSTRTFAEL